MTSIDDVKRDILVLAILGEDLGEAVDIVPRPGGGPLLSYRHDLRSTSLTLPRPAQQRRSDTPPLLLALGSRVMTRSLRLNMDTGTTNVPGPQQSVHALGRRLIVAIFSYDGGLYFGVTGDRDHAPDVDSLTTGIETGLSELLARAAAVPA